MPDGGIPEAENLAFGDKHAEAIAMRRDGQLAGVLFLLGAVVAFPSSLLIEAVPSAEMYGLTLLALVSGLICLQAPWELLGRGWLHLVSAVATVEVSALVLVIDRSYFFFFVIVAVYAAYVSRSRVALAAQLAFITLGLLSPLVYDPASARETAQVALLATIALAISAGMVMYLRERFEADRRAYRLFAQEALALAIRIRGKAEPALVMPPAPPRAQPHAGYSQPRMAALVAAIVLGVPCLSVGLAVAGVSLPEAARVPFEGLGIELPNQAGDDAVVSDADQPTTLPRVPASNRAKAPGGQEGQGGSARHASSTDGEANSQSSGSQTSATEGAAASASTAPTAPPPDGGSSTGGSDDSPSATAHSTQASPSEEGVVESADRALRERLDPLDGLLRGARER